MHSEAQTSAGRTLGLDPLLIDFTGEVLEGA